MPIIKSAKKRVRQNIVRTKRNERFKRSLRSEVKALENAVAENKKAEAKKQLPKAYSVIDTAVKKNLMHKNKAARQKSRLNEMVKNMGSSKTSAAKTTKKATKKTTKATAKKTAKKTT